MTTKVQQILLKEVDALIARYPDLDQVELIASDMVGNPFAKRFPIDQLRNLAENGLTLPRAMYVLDVTSKSIPEFVNMGLDDGDPDMGVTLVPGSLSVTTWGSRPRAQALLYGESPDAPVDPRQALAQVLKAYHEKGLTPVAAFELEFTLFDNTRTPVGDAKTVTNPKTGKPDKTIMLGAERLDGFETILDEIIANCDSQNIPTGAICAEYGAGQFEINFPHYDDVLRAADHAQLFRRTVKAVARRHGLQGSFIAKTEHGTPRQWATYPCQCFR